MENLQKLTEAGEHRLVTVDVDVAVDGDPIRSIFDDQAVKGDRLGFVRKRVDRAHDVLLVPTDANTTTMVRCGHRERHRNPFDGSVEAGKHIDPGVLPPRSLGNAMRS